MFQFLGDLAAGILNVVGGSEESSSTPTFTVEDLRTFDLPAAEEGDAALQASIHMLSPELQQAIVEARQEGKL